MNAKLTLAARLIEFSLRRVPFVQGRHRLAGHHVVFEPVMNDLGVTDENQLSCTIMPDLPPYILDRSQSLCHHYAQELARTPLIDTQIDALIAVLQDRCSPKPLRIARAMTRVLRPVVWALGHFVHHREAAPRSRVRERFGKTDIQRPQSRVIWLHAASLGEVKKLQNILIELSHQSGVTPVVTSYTASSAQWMATTFPDVIHQYAPLDTAAYIDRFLNHWRPECLVVVENELWPEMILGCARRGLRLVQLGARASSSRRKYHNVVGYLMTHFNLITCVNDDIRRDFIDIGIAAERVLTDDETAASSERLPVDLTQLAHLRDQIGTRPVWIAASTHPADVDIVLQAQAALCHTDTMVLIIAPRHPRDARAIVQACQKYGLSACQRSLGDAISENTNVYIADTFGELGTLFSLSNTVYLGGGIGPEGGHNPKEPAAFQCHIISGPNVTNHQDAFANLIAARQAEFVETAPDLVTAIQTHMGAEKSHHATGNSTTPTPQNPPPKSEQRVKLVLDHILGTADKADNPKENLV